MLFNSVTFVLFICLFFPLFWLINDKGSLKVRNILILVASYIFYGWWDWRFCGLIAFSTVIDYWVSLSIQKIYESTSDEESKQNQKAKYWLWLSLGVNLGLLGFFKYFNFFVENWIDAWAMFGIQMSVHTWSIILPVGISFYTFQTLSYTIDVYRKQMPATSDFISFAAYVAFFPQLVAGPIERASHLLPQIQQKRVFDYNWAVSGCKLALWGLFKKVVIADNISVLADKAFINYDSLGSLDLVAGVFWFAIQIYCDFSGYSDIAIGLCRVLGFDLMTNFKTPYFSRNIAEFWNRWHISLNTWFRDYVYIPLGGSREGKGKAFRNVMIIFLVSGFWHGANWTFIIWGLLHAIFFLPIYLFGNRKKVKPSDKIKLSHIPSILLTFTVVCFAWVFFRAENIQHALDYLKAIFTHPIINEKREVLSLSDLAVVGPFLMIELWVSKYEDGFGGFTTGSGFINKTVYVAIAVAMFYLMQMEPQSFIYFQF